jgi:hypothetical protein
MKAKIRAKFASLIRQSFAEEWVKNIMIPLDQKVTRLDERLNDIQDGEGISCFLVGFDQKISRIEARMDDMQGDDSGGSSKTEINKKFEQLTAEVRELKDVLDKAIKGMQ